MTRGIDGRKGEGKIFANTDEVRMAYDSREVGLACQDRVRIGDKRHETTVGRSLVLGDSCPRTTWSSAPPDGQGERAAKEISLAN